ncbi:unnamed protein product [Toxocara canis]|uniref:Nonsense-mediated mRNA decay factor SMG8 n=1 Tax=Toxocara canis TaxID=6265 RepID=A0A183UFF8_TOXCA|nr:unnamed protein product [Toxocara canis]
MREHLSEPLEDWLNRSVYNLSVHEERRVLVIAILGKEPSEHSKCDAINSFLQNTVFLSSNRSAHSGTAIDAFFASDISTVFLRLRGYGDVQCLESIFMKQNEQKGFFESISELERDYVRYLTFLLTFSHIFLFIEPCCRFDMNICQFLKKANELRLSTREEVSVWLGKIPNFPREWIIEGRLARPRLLFCFHRSPLRIDLGAAKKRELVTKLEQSMENQIFNVLKLHKIIGHTNKSYNCASVPAEGTPFVYVFSAREMPQDHIKDMIAYMVESNEGKEGDEDKKKKRDSEFGSFLKSNIDELRREPDKAILYELPRLKWLLSGGKIVYDLIIGKKALSDDAIAEVSNIELQFSKSMSSSYISLAKAAYTYRDGRDLEKRKPAMYSRREHEVKECEAIWETQKACEMISLTGNECTLPVHSGPDDLEVPAVKRMLHSSAARFLSTCNCGHSQALRNDPFTLKEANFDFYMHPQFTCCHSLERYKFAIFEKGVNAAEDLRESISFEDLDGPMLSSGDYRDLSDAEDDIEMLLDRDNRIERDADEQRSSDNSPCKDASGSGVGDESNSDLSELSDDRDEQDSSEEEEEIEEHIKHGGSRTQFRSLRAHMDDYDSSSAEENESAGGAEHTCYLDEDDVQLRERTDTDGDERFRTMAVEFEEHMANMRSRYKGQFLECLPNSDSQPLLPLFPSWALICLGPSSIYSHKAGLRDMPNFKNGSQFLLPWDVYLFVDTEEWDEDMKRIMSDSASHRPRRAIKPGAWSREKVKLFVGFEYECPRGHRFMIEDARTPMRAAAANSKESGAQLLRSEIPIWMHCTCRRAPQVCAQLMRIHVVTPKAPVTVTIDPHVQPSSRETTFYTGEEPIKLEFAKYYIFRLPYVYAGPQGPIRRPSEPTVMGKLLPYCIKVGYIPSQHIDDRR